MFRSYKALSNASQPTLPARLPFPRSLSRFRKHAPTRKISLSQSNATASPDSTFPRRFQTMSKRTCQTPSMPSLRNRLRTTWTHPAFVNGLTMGNLLMLAFFTLTDYFRTPESLIRKGERLTKPAEAVQTVWRARLAKREQRLAVQECLQGDCRRGYERESRPRRHPVEQRGQHQNARQRMLRKWVWRTTNAALSRKSPRWIYYRVLCMTYKSWLRGGVLGTRWDECEPRDD